jgi:hypothetical protein
MPDDPFESDLTSKEEFARDLSAMYRVEMDVPPMVDARVLAGARQHLSRSRGHRSFVLRISALVSAAAACVVIAVHFASPPKIAPSIAANHSVDIVDALRVASDIRDEKIDVKHDDFNHDGRVNQADVDAIAMVAVKLPEGRLQ